MNLCGSLTTRQPIRQPATVQPGIPRSRTTVQVRDAIRADTSTGAALIFGPHTASKHAQPCNKEVPWPTTFSGLPRIQALRSRHERTLAQAIDTVRSKGPSSVVQARDSDRVTA